MPQWELSLQKLQKCQHKSDKEIFLDGAIRGYRKLVLVEYEFNGITLEREAAISDNIKTFKESFSLGTLKTSKKMSYLFQCLKEKLNPKILL